MLQTEFGPRDKEAALRDGLLRVYHRYSHALVPQDAVEQTDLQPDTPPRCGSISPGVQPVFMKNTSRFRLSTQAGWGSNPLRIDISAPSEPFQGYELLEVTSLLHNLTVVNLCAPTNLEKEAARPEVDITDMATRKYNFPTTYNLFPLAMLICESLALRTQALAKAVEKGA